MIQSIELQMISKILTSEDDDEVNTLCQYDTSYYSVYKKQIEFILDHKDKYGNAPDVFTFQAQFVNDDITLVDVNEPIEFLVASIKKNKQYIIFVETFNKVQDLTQGDISEAWEYIGSQYENALKLSDVNPMNIVKQAEVRANTVVEFSKQTRIPTGFLEIDKLMYGGFSTVEELFLIVARTNTGKSWIVTRMAEAAQRAGFPVAIYSPEMRAEYLSTRFDSWRGHFKNSDLFLGRYSQEYWDYIYSLQNESTDAFIIEDKDMLDGVTARSLGAFVKQHGIKLLLVDGLSYMQDSRRSSRDYEKYKHICEDLFMVSKKYGCAVVVTAQANRETKDTLDDKGEPFPSLYQVSDSDAPARIATQAIAVRQIFDQHVLDIRLEKSRNAKNEKPVLSYSWDVNTGNVQYIPSDADMTSTDFSVTSVSSDQILNNVTTPDTSGINIDDLEDEDVEF